MPTRKIFAMAAAALLACAMATPAFAASDAPGGGGGGGGRSGAGGGGGGAPSGGGGGDRGAFRGGAPGPSAPAGRSFRGNPNFAGQHHGHHGYRHRGGPAYVPWAFYGLDVPFAYEYGWGYPDDEPDCYLRRVRINHHWVWRQYCD